MCDVKYFFAKNPYEGVLHPIFMPIKIRGTEIRFDVYQQNPKFERNRKTLASDRRIKNL
jgi:hypothetical protein